jgi:hypothetical protein
MSTIVADAPEPLLTGPKHDAVLAVHRILQPCTYQETGNEGLLPPDLRVRGFDPPQTEVVLVGNPGPKSQLLSRRWKSPPGSTDGYKVTTLLRVIDSGCDSLDTSGSSRVRPATGLAYL